MIKCINYLIQMPLFKNRHDKNLNIFAENTVSIPGRHVNAIDDDIAAKKLFRSDCMTL